MKTCPQLKGLLPNCFLSIIMHGVTCAQNQQHSEIKSHKSDCNCLFCVAPRCGPTWHSMFFEYLTDWQKFHAGFRKKFPDYFCISVEGDACVVGGTSQNVPVCGPGLGCVKGATAFEPSTCKLRESPLNGTSMEQQNQKGHA
jgi:hypothetical protein